MADQLRQYEERFGVGPPDMTGDRIYGTHCNRKLLKEAGIRDAFEPRGRKPLAERHTDRWLKRIEGAIGHVKTHFGLARIKYSIEGGDELWVRLGLLAANLKTAASKV